MGGIMVTVREILDHIKPGETVLVEHSSRAKAIMLFYELVNWAKEKGYPVVVDDVLDTLYLYKAQLELARKDTSFLNEVKVIKAGGRLNVGQVVGRVKIDDPTVLEREYREIAHSLLREGEIAVNPALGLEKLFLATESARDVLVTLYNLIPFAGDKRRIAFYFINTDVVGYTLPVVLPLLEEGASTVIEVDIEKKSEIGIGKVAYRFLVVNLVHNELSGLEFMLP